MSMKSAAVSTWPGMRAGSLLALSGPTAVVRPLTGSAWSLFVAMSVKQRNIIYFSALEKKNCLKKNLAYVKIAQKKIMRL